MTHRAIRSRSSADHLLFVVLQRAIGCISLKGHDFSLAFDPFLEFFADASSVNLLATTDLYQRCDSNQENFSTGVRHSTIRPYKATRPDRSSTLVGVTPIWPRWRVNATLNCSEDALAPTSLKLSKTACVTL
jgi:hypothetical protein